MIEIKNLSKIFQTADGPVSALKDVNIDIQDGDIYGIIGMSGAGKSTLVRCINLIERPTEGSVIIDGTDITELSEKELRKIRRNVTMIFQSFNLLMQRNCIQNICFPLELAGVGKKEARARAKELLELVGLPDKADVYPAQLSGGQKQRIAIARALATDPKVLLCDEATSALDPKTTNQILDLIREINAKLGITVIIITHQMSVVENVCNKVSILDKGVVVETGNVADVFANPQSDEAKRLVFPEQEDTGLVLNMPGRTVLSVSFNNSETTDSPMIAKLAMEHGIAASILYAATRSVEGKAFGKMLLGVDDEKAEETLALLNQNHGVLAEVADPAILSSIVEKGAEA